MTGTGIMMLAREDLKALIDLLYFSHLPPQQVKQLAEKLKRIQIRSFDDGKTLVRNLPSAGKAADFDPGDCASDDGRRGKEEDFLLL